jgi:hypothetical protein
MTLRPRTCVAAGRIFGLAPASQRVASFERRNSAYFFQRTGAFSLHSPPQRLFRAPGEPAGSALKSASA